LDKQMIPGRLAYEHTLCAENLTVGNIGAKKVSSMLLGESDRFLTRSKSFCNVGKRKAKTRC